MMSAITAIFLPQPEASSPWKQAGDDSDGGSVALVIETNPPLDRGQLKGVATAASDEIGHASVTGAMERPR